MLKALKNILTGIPHIPPDAKNGILHISDTPRQIYRWLSRLIQETNPSYIIHTGDVADDIKLELAPERLKHSYISAISQFKHTIKGYEERTYIIVGNHDNPAILSTILSKAKIIPEPYQLQIENLSFFLSHKPPSAINGYDFILFGHQPTNNDSENYLNGLIHCHIITLKGLVFKIHYPKGTNRYRKLRWGDGNDLIHRGP